MPKLIPPDNQADTPDEVAALLALDSDPPDSPFHWSNLQPKSDQEWAAYFDEFDRRLHHSPRISIRQYLGYPKLRPLEEIPLEEVPQVLEFALDLLAEHNIALDVLADVEDAVLYRFILDEFLDEEINALPIPGSTCHYIYEEFHPNHRYTITNQASEDLHSLLTFHPEFYRYTFMGDLLYDENGEPIAKEAILERIDHFHHIHRQIEAIKTEVNEIQIEDEDAWANVTIEWISVAEIPDDTETFRGTASLRFKRDGDYWYLIQAKIPGLPINVRLPVEWDNRPRRTPPDPLEIPLVNPFES